MWDDKSLSAGDELICAESGSEKEFARVLIEKVIEKKLGEFTEEDKAGHEKFASDLDMYAAYKEYYRKEVRSETLVKNNLY